VDSLRQAVRGAKVVSSSPETALVQLPGDRRPLHLRKSGGRWYALLFAGPDRPAAERDEALDVLARMAAVLQEGFRELESGLEDGSIHRGNFDAMYEQILIRALARAGPTAAGGPG
jgi:hypothetical protein